MGHARELTQAALNRGVTSVFAWGGDGTVNEVASAPAFARRRWGSSQWVGERSGSRVAHPVGSRPRTAAALDGRECRMDAGELDLKLFLNVAGIGSTRAWRHRRVGRSRSPWSLRHLEIAAREFFTYKSTTDTITTDGVVVRVDALLIAIANSRQYGNGALIAPAAALDDGRLDVVVVAGRSPLGIILQAPRLFMGQIERAPGVTSVKGVEIEVTSGQPVPYHVDGEPFLGGSSSCRARPSALRVVVPSDAPADVSAACVAGDMESPTEHMQLRHLVVRGLTYYWRTNVAVVIGVATAVAVLAGALLVGDSVRGSLRDLVLQRLGQTDLVVASVGFFREALADDVRQAQAFRTTFREAAPLVIVPGFVTAQESGRRVGDVRVYGVDDWFWRFMA